MFEVQLMGLNRLNLGGVVYQKGVRRPVSREAALALMNHPKFKVYGLTPAEMAIYHDDQVRPRGPDLGDAIRDAIGSLESVDPENYNRDGKPALAALSSFLGYQVSAEQRDAAIANEPEEEPSVASVKPAPAEALARPKGGVRFVKPPAADTEQKVAV